MIRVEFNYKEDSNKLNVAISLAGIKELSETIEIELRSPAAYDHFAVIKTGLRNESNWFVHAYGMTKNCGQDLKECIDIVICYIQAGLDNDKMQYIMNTAFELRRRVFKEQRII